MQDLHRQVVIALRWSPLILIGAIVAGALAYTVMSDQPKVYEATARLLVDPGPDPDMQSVALAENAAVRYAEQARSRSVAEAVIEELGLPDTPERLIPRIGTSTSEETLELSITARDDTAESASLLALTLGDLLRERVRDSLTTTEVRAADSAIAANQRSIKTLQSRLTQLRQKPVKNPADRSEMIALAGQISVLQRDIQIYQPSSRAFIRNRLDWLERPTLPSSPVEPRPLYWALLALVVGGMLAAAAAFVLEYLRGYNKIRDERELEAAVDLPALGSVVEKRGDIGRGDPHRLVMLLAPKSAAADSYRALLARIGFAHSTGRTLMVASVDGADGTNAVAGNLALAYAEAGRKVILVDGDLRSPRLHSFFGVPNDRGLTNTLVDRDIPLQWVIVPTSHPGLRLMPAGPRPPRSSDPLGVRQVDGLLDSLLTVADLVIVVSPPLGAGLDAAVLAKRLQEAVLVVPSGARADEAAGAAQALRAAGTEVVGAILYRQARGSHKRSALAPPISLPPSTTGWPAWPATGPLAIPAVVSRMEPRPQTLPPQAPAVAGDPVRAATSAPGPAGFVLRPSEATQPSPAARPLDAAVPPPYPPRPLDPTRPVNPTRASHSGPSGPPERASGAPSA